MAIGIGDLDEEGGEGGEDMEEDEDNEPFFLHIVAELGLVVKLGLALELGWEVPIFDG